MLRDVNLTSGTVEAIGDRLARTVLASAGPEMVDLRAQRGVGIDADDELRRFYALKVYGGEEPDEIRLTKNEARSALDDENFFLVVVSGVDDKSVERTVKVIAAPLEQLRKDDSAMYFAGVRSARSLVYRIATGDEE